jgi:RNA polymerase sigma-70 factor (ECF subfamily)
MVLAAGDSQDPDSRNALAALCRTYWYPIYAQVRHLGHDADTARDLTQGFFAFVLEKRTLKVAHPDRGRFRAFLKTSLRHFISHERERAQALKRGGGERLLELDFDSAESQYRVEPAHEQTPEKLFEKRWARTLMQRALDHLREEMAESSAADRFRRLEPFLVERPPHGSYREVAADLDMTEDAVKTAVRRLRQRFGKLLRIEVARTVEDPGDVDEEIRYLFSAIRS